MPTPAASENFSDLLEPGLRKIFTDTYNEPGDQIGMVYEDVSASTSYIKDSQVGALADLDDFDAAGQVQYDDVSQGYDTQLTPKQYAKGFKIERALFDDDLYNIINKKPAALGTSASRTRDKHKASIFNNAFSGTNATWQTGGDGLALCASAHTSTASSGFTNISNTGTTALSATAVEATRRLMVKFTDDRGNLISVIPDTLVVPRNLEETAWTIVATKGIVGSGENDANFHQGKYKIIVSDRLTDSNNWFFLDSKIAKMSLLFVNRIAPEFAQDKDFDTLIAKFRVYARWAVGWSDWRGVYGHNVS